LRVLGGDSSEGDQGFSVDQDESTGAMSAGAQHAIESWHVLVSGLQLREDVLDLGCSLTLRRIVNPLTVFDLAAAGAVGFREWCQ
jgi:hypothetical protein